MDRRALEGRRKAAAEVAAAADRTRKMVGCPGLSNPLGWVSVVSREQIHLQEFGADELARRPTCEHDTYHTCRETARLPADPQQCRGPFRILLALRVLFVSNVPVALVRLTGQRGSRSALVAIGLSP